VLSAVQAIEGDLCTMAISLKTYRVPTDTIGPACRTLNCRAAMSRLSSRCASTWLHVTHSRTPKCGLRVASAASTAPVAAMAAIAATAATAAFTGTTYHAQLRSSRHKGTKRALEKSGEMGPIADAIFAKVQQGGVPVRDQVMEYTSAPMRTPLEQLAIPAIGERNAVKALVDELMTITDDADRAEVGAATLCLMVGGVDEAHNLVTPHSWPAPTTFGGPPKHNSTMSKEAAYCHVIVHRMEGTNYGEFGTGYNNSSYWIGNAFGSGKHAIFPELRKAAEELSSSCSDARSTLRAMGPDWKPVTFNRLCEEALDSEDKELLDYCAAVQAKELELLYRHIVKHPDQLVDERM